MPHKTHQIINDVRIIKEYRRKGEKWVGNGESFTTMVGYTGENEVWQKCIATTTIGKVYTVTKIFVYAPSQDDLTRIQSVYGSDPQVEYNNGNYSEALFMFNGSSHSMQELTFPRVPDLDLWIRPMISNNPTKDATIRFFVCIQTHEV